MFGYSMDDSKGKDADVLMGRESIGILRQLYRCRRRRIHLTVAQSFCMSLFLFALWLTLNSYIEIVAYSSKISISFHKPPYDTSSKSGYKQATTGNNTKSTPWAQFDQVSIDNPKMVILLSYQRCGSTLVSQLFNQNSEAFYYFEPLDSLYSSLYGTPFGWNVPSDITSNNDGTRRNLPESEIREVTDFLSNLLSCEVDKLPIETLFHPYHYVFSGQFLSTADYVSCIKNINGTLNKCRPAAMNNYCGTRFNQVREDRMRSCWEMMKNPKNQKADQRVRDVFKGFEQCKKYLMDKAHQEGNCLDMFLESCSRKSLRAVKTVRGTMDPIASLFERHRNLRVVHLIRDPRGVAQSRFKLNRSVQSIHALQGSGNNTEDFLVQEAAIYCRTVADDLIKKAAIEKKYPGRILTVVYDDLVTNTSKYVDEIYQFLDIPIVDDRPYKALGIKVNLGDQTNSNIVSLSTSQNIAFNWHKSISFEARLKILSVCKDFYSNVDYSWKL